MEGEPPSRRPRNRVGEVIRTLITGDELGAMDEIRKRKSLIVRKNSVGPAVREEMSFSHCLHRLKDTHPKKAGLK